MSEAKEPVSDEYAAADVVHLVWEQTAAKAGRPVDDIHRLLAPVASLEMSRFVGFGDECGCVMQMVERVDAARSGRSPRLRAGHRSGDEVVITDDPKTADQVLAAVARGLNDADIFHDSDRRKACLLPLVPLLLDTAIEGHRGAMASALDCFYTAVAAVGKMFDRVGWTRAARVVDAALARDYPNSLEKFNDVRHMVILFANDGGRGESLRVPLKHLREAGNWIRGGCYPLSASAAIRAIVEAYTHEERSLAMDEAQASDWSLRVAGATGTILALFDRCRERTIWKPAASVRLEGGPGCLAGKEVRGSEFGAMGFATFRYFDEGDMREAGLVESYAVQSPPIRNARYAIQAGGRVAVFVA